MKRTRILRSMLLTKQGVKSIIIMKDFMTEFGYCVIALSILASIGLGYTKLVNYLCKFDNGYLYIGGLTIITISFVATFISRTNKD